MSQPDYLGLHPRLRDYLTEDALSCFCCLIWDSQGNPPPEEGLSQSDCIVLDLLQTACATRQNASPPWRLHWLDQGRN